MLRKQPLHLTIGAIRGSDSNAPMHDAVADWKGSDGEREGPLVCLFF